MAEIHWDDCDDKSLARMSTLTIRNKKIETPIRAASIGEGVTSEDRIVETYAGVNHPLLDLCMVYRGVNATTIQNIERSNGKFNELRRAVRNTLNGIPSSSMRMLYLRIPKVSKFHDTKIEMDHLAETETEALFDFITQFDTDIVVLPIPPMIREIGHFRKIIDTYFDSMETFNVSHSFMGYVPNVDDPSLAGEMAQYYLEKGLRLIGIDFGGGHPRRTITTVIRRLRDLGEDYYLHAFNVHPSKPSERDVTNILDLLMHTYGFDSFSNVGWGGGGGSELSEQELRERVRYPLLDDYGAYRYKALKQRMQAQGGDETGCVCPICEQEGVDDLYGNNESSQLRYKVKVHRIFSDSYELGNISRRISEQQFMPYLEGKSNLQNPLNQIRKDLSNIARREMTVDDF